MFYYVYIHIGLVKLKSYGKKHSDSFCTAKNIGFGTKLGLRWNNMILEGSVIIIIIIFMQYNSTQKERKLRMS